MAPPSREHCHNMLPNSLQQWTPEHSILCHRSSRLNDITSIHQFVTDEILMHSYSRHRRIPLDDESNIKGVIWGGLFLVDNFMDQHVSVSIFFLSGQCQ